MYKIWLIFHPRLGLIGMSAMLTVLAVVIHTLLLSSDRYNWVEGVSGGGDIPIAQQQAAPPQRQTQ